MRDIDPSWRPYARLQQQCRSRSSADALGWGIEAGLDEILELRVAGAPPPESPARAVERGKARERHRARLLGLYAAPDAVEDPRSRLEDRARIREAMASLDEAGRTMLVAIGLGHGGTDVARALGVAPAAMRKRLGRVRQALAA